MTNRPRVFLTHLRQVSLAVHKTILMACLALTTQVFGVLNYINDAEALDKRENILRAIRWEWHNYAQLYARFIGGINIPIVAGMGRVVQGFHEHPDEGHERLAAAVGYRRSFSLAG